MSVAYQEDAPIELAGTRRPVPHRRYLALLIIPPLLGYLFGFFLVRMPGYERWGAASLGRSSITHFKRLIRMQMWSSLAIPVHYSGLIPSKWVVISTSR